MTKLDQRNRHGSHAISGFRLRVTRADHAAATGVPTRYGVDDGAGRR